MPAAVRRRVLFGLLAAPSTTRRRSAFARVAADGIFGLVVPIAALVIGDAVLGAEIRSGMFHFTWLSPDPPGRSWSGAGSAARSSRW